MNLLSAPGSLLIKITPMKSLPCRAIMVHQIMFLSKQVLTTVADRCCRWSKFLEPIHFKGDLVLQETLPGAKRPLRMASAIPAILGKYASITAVDLIQWKKLDSRNFYESKGSQIWNYFILYCSIRRMTVLCMNSGISDMITILTSAAFL